MESVTKEMEMKQAMNVTDYNFDLPQELIAQDPLEDRSSSRLLVLNKETGEMEHRVFRDIVEYLHPGDCLVINDTKVIPAHSVSAITTGDLLITGPGTTHSRTVMEWWKLI